MITTNPASGRPHNAEMSAPELAKTAADRATRLTDLDNPRLIVLRPDPAHSGLAGISACFPALPRGCQPDQSSNYILAAFMTSGI